MPNQVFTQTQQRARQAHVLVRDARSERQAVLKQTLTWLAAGSALVALSFAFSQTVHAQAAPVDPYAGDLETYSCSPNSQALLSQVQLMKAAGSQLRERWAEQGFGIGNHMPDTGAHIFAGAQPSVMASAFGTHSATTQTAAYGHSAADAGTGGHVAIPSAMTSSMPAAMPRNVSYGSLFHADDGAPATSAQQAARPQPSDPATVASDASLAATPAIALPGAVGNRFTAATVQHAAMGGSSSGMAAGIADGTPGGANLIPAPSANQTIQTAVPMQPPVQTAMPASLPMSAGASTGLSDELHSGLMTGDPQAVRQGLNVMMNSVDPIRPDYQRFFHAHPSMQEHLKQAQEMGLGPGPIIIDPNTVARQFGLEYNGSMVDPYSFMPPDTGSALSRLALRFRSLFYSH